MTIPEIIDIFKVKNWRVNQIESDAVRFTQPRRLPPQRFWQVTRFFIILYIGLMIWVIVPYLQGFHDKGFSISFFSMLIGICPTLVIFVIGYLIFLHGFLVEEADENILFTQHADGSFSISRQNTEHTVRTIDEVVPLADIQRGESQNRIIMG